MVRGLVAPQHHRYDRYRGLQRVVARGHRQPTHVFRAKLVRTGRPLLRHSDAGQYALFYTYATWHDHHGQNSSFSKVRLDGVVESQRMVSEYGTYSSSRDGQRPLDASVAWVEKFDIGQLRTGDGCVWPEAGRCSATPRRCAGAP